MSKHAPKPKPSAEVGKPLVTIMPDGEPLVVEALLMNRDAGFVRAGQRVVIKLDAYPFTRYGTLEGVVERVSPDSTFDQHAVWCSLCV